MAVGMDTRCFVFLIAILQVEESVHVPSESHEELDFGTRAALVQVSMAWKINQVEIRRASVVYHNAI